MNHASPLRFLSFDEPIAYRVDRIAPIAFRVRWSPKPRASLSCVDYQDTRGPAPALRISRPLMVIPWAQIDERHASDDGTLADELGLLFQDANKTARSGAFELSEPIVNVPDEPPNEAIVRTPDPQIGQWQRQITDGGWPVMFDVTTKVRKRVVGVGVQSVYLDMRNSEPVLRAKIQLIVSHPTTVAAMVFPVESLRLSAHATWHFLTHVCTGLTIENEIRNATDAAIANAFGRDVTAGWPEGQYFQPAWGKLPAGSPIATTADVFGAMYTEDGERKAITDPSARFETRYLIATLIQWSCDNPRLLPDGDLSRTQGEKQLAQREAQGIARNRLRMFGQFLYMRTDQDDDANVYAFDLTAYEMRKVTDLDHPGKWPLSNKTPEQISGFVDSVWCDGIDGNLADSFDGYCELVGLPIA